jgi:dTDP-4-dehydrorhamnose 3,5-epimerase
VKAIDLPIAGAKLLAAEPFRDSRGSFEVFWEQADLAAAGIPFAPVNSCHSYNQKSGTLRGMHFQQAPHGQTKLVSCVQGAAWDVIVDLRPDSPAYQRWHGETLEADSGRAVFIPAGCAHGFLTLKDDTTIAYLIEGNYNPKAAGVVRWNDPAFGIEWPVGDPFLSERDRLAPDFIA